MSKYKAKLMPSFRDMLKFINEEKDENEQDIDRELIAFDIEHITNSTWFIYTEQKVGLQHL